jgi:hypothetical protein
MTKQIRLLFTLCTLISSSVIINIKAKTESLSLAKIKSSVEIFQKHIQKVDEMNPDNSKEIKRVLHLIFEAINIEMTEYIHLSRKEKYTDRECREKASLKRKTFCISHRIGSNELDKLLSDHDCSIVKNVFENTIVKYIAQHKILEHVIGYNPGSVFYY